MSSRLRHTPPTAAASMLALSAGQRDVLSSAFNSSLHSPYPIFTDCICTFRSVNDRADGWNRTLSVPGSPAWVNPSDFQGKIELHGGQRRRAVIRCNMGTRMGVGGRGGVRRSPKCAWAEEELEKQ